MHQDTQISFSLSMLHPRYWATWFGFILTALLVNILPYSFLFYLSQAIGKLLAPLTKKRKAIALRNFQLAFPDKTEQQLHQMTTEHMANVSLWLLETGIAWFWPDWRFKRIISSHNFSLLNQQSAKQGVLMLCPHTLNLEITARTFALKGHGGYGVYRAHTNPVYEFIQTRGRCRSGNQLIDRSQLKKMVKVLKQGESLFFLPDHDYGANGSVFVPFFSVKDTCTTKGPFILQKLSNSQMYTCTSFRNHNKKYDLIIDKIDNAEINPDNIEASCAMMNRKLEKVIMRAPTQWMWIHRRFKTEQGKSRGSRYKNLDTKAKG